MKQEKKITPLKRKKLEWGTQGFKAPHLPTAGKYGPPSKFFRGAL